MTETVNERRANGDETVGVATGQVTKDLYAKGSYSKNGMKPIRWLEAAE